MTTCTEGQTVQTPQGPALFSHYTDDRRAIVSREDIGVFSVPVQWLSPYTAAAKAYGESDLYVGDDGQLYVSPA
jgi:hypothetical protein